MIFLLAALSASAREVTPSEAESMAASFFGGRVRKTAPVRLKRMMRSGDTSVGEASEYYIYNNGDNDGFVIIAGDTNVSPVLGYSATGSFDWDNLPPSMEEWLEQIKEYVRAMSSDAMSRNGSGTLAAKVSAPDVKVLYETAEWGQGYPFNSRCPLYGSERTLTGCVATSFAILLRYFKYPYSGYNETESYSYTDASGNDITVESESLSGPFNWDDMPLKYSRSWTQENISAVSEIMYLCSVSAKAEFGVNETMGYTYQCHKVLQNNLGYDRASLYHHRSWYDDTEWLSRIVSHLDGVGPLLYSAGSKDGGHSFVVDGYDSEMNFHINWGWGGYQNGFFAFPAWLSYKYNHQAAFDVQPDRGGIPKAFLSLSNSWGCTGITLDGAEEIVENADFSITCGFLGVVSVSTPFSGYVVAATIDRYGKLKEFISKESRISLNAGRGYRAYHLNCKISEDIEIGDKITLFQRSTDDSEWSRVVYDRDYVVGELPISDLQTIEETTSLSYDAEENVLTIGLKDAVLYSLESSGVSYLSGVSEKDTPLLVDASGLPSGNYELCLKKKKETVNLELNIGGKKDE